MNVSFKIRHSKNPKLPAGIQARVCVSGLFSDVSTGVFCPAKYWKKNEVVGAPNAKKLNNDLSAEKTKLINIYDHLRFTDPERISAKNITQIYNGVADAQKNKEKSIVVVLRELVEQKYTTKIIQKPNYERYIWHILQIEAFFKLRKLEDLTYSDIKYSVFEDLINYIRVTSFKKEPKAKTKANQTKEQILVKKNVYVKRYAQLLTAGNEFALRKEYTQKSLPKPEQFKNDSDDTVFLTFAELETLEKFDFSDDLQFDEVRDVFVFCAYTGFQWCDLLAFDAKTHLEFAPDGEWVIKPRQKNDNDQVVPYFPQAKAILEKYNYELPLILEHEQNQIIKMVMKRAKINKYITNRCGRKTAGMVWLNNGYSIESVSKMLGHEDIRTTQKHYATILRERLGRETKEIRNRKA